MARFYLPPELWTEAPALVGEEARHFSQVLRKRIGDRITVFDGLGRRAQAEATHVARDCVSLRLAEITISPPSKPEIILAQAIPKGKSMDLIVQKSVELGVTAIQPLITRNTIVQPGDGKSEKWRRIALEACKQCGQDNLPKIAEPLHFETWVMQESIQPGRKIIASLAHGTLPLRKILRIPSDLISVIFLIGPEGDFSSHETEMALAEGFTPASLGKIVLRVETAAIFCVAAAHYEIA